MNLHDAGPNVITRLAWFALVGRNGHVLGRGDQKAMHLWRVERGTPPELGNRNRRYWNPWQTSPPNDQVLHPICGVIRTTARRPQFGWYTHFTKCRNCVRIAAQRGEENPQAWYDMRYQDPWVRIPHDMRLTTVDPVTGL